MLNSAIFKADSFALQVKYLALAQENVPLAMELLETAFIRGQWLIFQVHAPHIQH